ncbi:MAG TPA: 3-deoxy-D-manno-octulosonic acid transferase [Tepidisphaeraceae bacterium]|jgi:3-deoxy-D-manno-octulosonic-acid transferase|nr:3-deoxy-D-manno-octulosonic acid transferase [Tepidisphaeraceae bacterium]
MTAYDLAYGLAIAVASPFWLLSAKLRPRILDAIRRRNGDVPAAASNAPAILIHAVSMGEINATTSLVKTLAAARPDLRFIISTTSRTGQERARQLYESNPRVTRVRFPFDFSRSVARLLDAQRPSVAVLMELEVWPNFMRECERRGIPVILVNGRLSAHSFRGYRLAGLFTRKMFKRLAMACVQDEVYAGRFDKVGVPIDRIRVTGTMKFDTAEIADEIAGADMIARAVGLRPGEDKIWVCGSTGPGEEQIVLQAYAKSLAKFPALRLVIVPRHPQRFDEVAEFIRGQGHSILRRSQAAVGSKTSQAGPAVILGDTMGELRKFYSLADVVFVGRTLVDLGPKQHGSDMIEPAALAKPIIVGPYTGNFADVMNGFRAGGAIVEVRDQTSLQAAVDRLLSGPAVAEDLGRKAQDFVRANQGATVRHSEVILGHFPADAGSSPLHGSGPG